jgi:signal transduction histidine kinase
MYESEEKALTAELLLTKVNTGKFETPWDTFRKDAIERNQPNHAAYAALMDRPDDPVLSAIIETPVSFANGHTQVYRYRGAEQLAFALVVDVLRTYLEHPAFGLEVILSGRFRHNNLLQEMLAAIASVQGSTIPGVPGNFRTRLAEGYKAPTEAVVNDWCSERMQTRRAARKQALFDLVPSQKDMAELLQANIKAANLGDIVDSVTQWVKARLAAQVELARDAFSNEIKTRLLERFAAVAAAQIAAQQDRDVDVERVRSAITAATERRIDELRSWFDGVDGEVVGEITLAELVNATNALFDNLEPDRELVCVVHEAAKNVTFNPNEVKLAFDLLREVLYNALRHGEGGRVELRIDESPRSGGPIGFRFANASAPGADDTTQTFTGHCYVSADDAIFREGNSGCAKVAAISATLINGESQVSAATSGGTYRIDIPLRPRTLFDLMGKAA